MARALLCVVFVLVGADCARADWIPSGNGWKYVEVPGRTIDDSHHCPVCGLERTTVARESGGMHSHACNHAGTLYSGKPAVEWWHANPEKTYTLPASSGCENGNCPSPTIRRGLIFRRW